MVARSLRLKGDGHVWRPNTPQVRQRVVTTRPIQGKGGWVPKLKLSLNVATCDRMKTELKARWEKTLRHKISGKDKLKILRIFLSQARREILSETPTR